MNAALFKRLTKHLLAKHYGLNPADADLDGDQMISECIQQNIRPYQVVNEHAEETDLDRIDLEGFYGVPSKALLRIADELDALDSVRLAVVIPNHSMCCPVCGTGTRYEELEPARQHHFCLGESCGHEFVLYGLRA
jgi:hypothetical protein